MRLKRLEKTIAAGVLMMALVIPVLGGGKEAKAEETKIDFATNADGSLHETSFELANTDVKGDTLNGYEKDNGKNWVKLFSKFDGTKNIFDEEDIPDGTAKIKVVFDITNYDLDAAYPLTWATGIGGWTAGKPTGVTIDRSGTYEAVLDFASETDGIGREITPGDINSASLQLVFQLGEGKQDGIADVKKTKVTFKACYAYEASDTVTAAAVVPITDETASPAPADTSSVSENKVTKLTPAKKTVSVKKGKKVTVVFNITTAVKGKETTDKLTKATVAAKKTAKVIKKTLTAKKCSIQVKGLKKGKTVLTVKVGSKTAKVTVKVS